MERDPYHRYTQVVLLVEWDPEKQDHPQGWDWSTLLGNEAEVLDFENKEDTDVPRGT